MMRPASPVIAGLEDVEIRIGEGQAGVEPLPALRTEDGASILTRWELDDADRARIAAGGPVWMLVRNGGRPLQPVSLTTEDPCC